MGTHPGFQQFSELIAPWCPAYHYRKISWLAHRTTTDENWHLIYARVEFLCDQLPAGSSPFILTTSNLFAGNEVTVLGVDDTREWLDTLESQPSQLCVHGEIVSLNAGSTGIHNFNMRTNEGDILPLASPNFHFYPRGLYPIDDSHRRTALQISVNQNGSPHINTQDIELQLFNAKMPVNGIADLLLRIDAPGSVLHGTQAPSINVVAEAPARFRENCLFQTSTAQLRVQISRGLNRELFSLGLVHVEKSGPSRSSYISGNQIKWNKEAVDGEELDVISVSGLTAPTIVFFLRYKDEYLDRISLSDRTRTLNELYELHRIVDRKDALGVMLSNSVPGKFDKGLALLLGNLGLTVLHYGDVSQFSDGPDMYAISGADDLYIVEVTVGHPDHKGKLHKLYERTREVREICQNGGLSFKIVQPVLVTALPRIATQEVAAQAADLGIALICEEQLSIWRKSLGAFPKPTADALRNDFRRAIPLRNENDTDN